MEQVVKANMARLKQQLKVLSNTISTSEVDNEDIEDIREIIELASGLGKLLLLPYLSELDITPEPYLSELDITPEPYLSELDITPDEGLLESISKVLKY